LGEKKQELLSGLVREKQGAFKDKEVFGVGGLISFIKTIICKNKMYICRQI
jgi:hypothetical protein